MTRQDLIDKLIIGKSKSVPFNWGHFLAMVNQMSQTDKDSIIVAIDTNDVTSVGTIILKYVRQEKKTLAENQVLNKIDNKDRILLTDIAELL